jgi:predicted anti-sigma-YlaC factor YlaD
MTSVLDDALVGVALAVSVAYAVYSLGPRAWRPRFLTGAAALLGHVPQFIGLRSVARRLAAAAAAKSTAACGGCDNCGSNAAPAENSAASSDVRIPLSKIGKRLR